jgi:hypothetical protein
MRYRLCLMGLLILTGCKSTEGPLAYRKPSRVDDPMLSIEEQKARGRLRYSYIEDNHLSPHAFVDRPDPTYSGGIGNTSR